MSQFNVRFNVYDSAVENVLNTLKRCNKQAAFVRDAVKFYVDSKQGQKTFNLMCGTKSKKVKQPKQAICTPSSPSTAPTQEQPDAELATTTSQSYHHDDMQSQKSILSKIFS